MITKANVRAFNDDALSGGYRYTDSTADVAKRFSNTRTSAAIANATVFAGRTVLDIGCGDGTFTLELAALQPRAIVAIDPAADAVARARTRSAGMASDIRFEVANVYDLSPDFGRFDIVVLRGVLHHLADPARALSAAASVGDELVVLEPNGCNPVLKLIERLSHYHVEHEEQSFLPRTIDRWLKEAGKTPVARQMLNLVPLFCDARLARCLKRCEPIVEATPLLRTVACGQYLVRAV